ncbi:MAG: 50S ribosomal protein L25 [Deltaproteobacteria bacterium]|nr:50S ribosomal protein L25 [Deltaproteobacteria bacterium]
MSETVLNVSLREASGKSISRSLRRQGEIPAVCYGKGLDSCPVAVNIRALKKVLSTEAGLNALIKIQGEGPFSGKVVIVKDLQIEPLSRRPLHVDFQAIDLTKKTQVMVPLKIVGKAIGEKSGGVLQIIYKEVEVSCLPTAIPPFLEVDVNELNVGDSINIDDLVFPDGVEKTHEENYVVVNVSEIKAMVEEEEEAAAGEEAAEGEEAEAAEEAAEEAESQE